MPWWAREAIAEMLGCPVACYTLGVLSREWGEIWSHLAVEHDVYRCCRSRRSIALHLPWELAPPKEGLTPAAYSGLWRRHSRELDLEGFNLRGCCCPPAADEGSSSSSTSGPVRCPIPGCDHEEPSAELAMRHSASCPVAAAARAAGGRLGFCYASPEEVSAALRRRALREIAEVILDLDLGSARSTPMRCVCEIDEEAPGLLLRELEEGWDSVRISLDKCTGLHRGWQLNDAARLDYEQGAFPRTVDLVVFSGSYDNTYDYYTSRLSGWSFCPRRRQRLLSADAWDRTVVVQLRAAPGAEKQRRFRKLLQVCAQGNFDTISVYVLGLLGDTSLLDSEFPSASDAWRNALRWKLSSVGSSLTAARRKEAERLLAASCPTVRRKDIEVEYADCERDFLFIAFASQEAAERFHQHLSGALDRAKSRQ